jgi:hypothetical protein
VEEMMQACYEAIKDRIGLSDEDGDNYMELEEFQRVYVHWTKKIFNDCRQYAQTRMKGAVEGRLVKKMCLLP